MAPIESADNFFQLISWRGMFCSLFYQSSSRKKRTISVLLKKALKKACLIPAAKFYS